MVVNLFDPVDPVFSAELLPNTLLFGSLEVAVSSAINGQFVGTFMGKNHRTLFWQNIPHDDLFGILDLRQAKYAEEDIKQIYNLKELPSTETIHVILGRCTRCFAIGHLADSCTAKTCAICCNFDRACCCIQTQLGQRKRICHTCNSAAHQSTLCPARLWCSFCCFLGHSKRDCDSGFSP